MKADTGNADAVESTVNDQLLYNGTTIYRTTKILTKHGIGIVKCSEYQNQGHDAFAFYQDPAFFEWLFSRKVSYPPPPVSTASTDYAETFELYAAGMSLAGTNGWNAEPGGTAAVSADAGLVDGVAAYGVNHAYPVNAGHEKVGVIAGNSRLRVVSPSNAAVTVKMLLYMSPEEGGSIPEAEAMAGTKLALLLDADGHVRIMHGTPLTGERHWSTISDCSFNTGEWHVATLELDYATVGQGSRYFRVGLDDGPWLTHPRGYTRNDGSGAGGGEWFAFADVEARNLNGLSFEGDLTAVDDILVAENWSGPGGAGDRDADGMWDFWEMHHFGATNDPAGGAGADWDGDGFDNLSEWTADTDPGSTDSVLEIRHIAVEDSGVRVSWRGGRAATQYLERRDDLQAGAWQAVFTNAPPTDVVNELLDGGSPYPGGFYRIRAVR